MWGGWFLPLFTSAIIFCSGANARILESPDQILRKFEKISDTSSRNCTEPSAELSPKAFLQSQTCASLFSLSAPSWIQTSRFGTFFQGTQNWNPVCSLVQFNGVTRLNGDQKIPEIIKQIKESDACVYTTEDRDSKDYKPSTQEEVGETVMTPVELNEVKKKFEAIRSRVTGICCGESDPDCKRIMKSVEVQFCKPQSDPKKADLCIGGGTYYESDIDPEWERNLKKTGVTQKNLASVVGKFELRPGWVTVSPLKGEDAPAVYAHELGHACSQIRRKLAIYRGSVNELKEYLDESCKITPDSERTYERLFASIGYADTTIECVKGIANNLVNDRFQVGKCKDGCPGTGIEESYAEGMALMSTPDEKWVPDLIPVYLCDGERDSGHPLSEDMFACLLKSPNVLGRVKRATQCKE